MRFMMIMFPKGYENAKPGWAPDLKDMEATGKHNEELGKAGVLLALDGADPARDHERARHLQKRKIAAAEMRQ
jgi:hypothetical protein